MYKVRVRVRRRTSADAAHRKASNRAEWMTRCSRRAMCFRGDRRDKTGCLVDVADGRCVLFAVATELGKAIINPPNEPVELLMGSLVCRIFGGSVDLEKKKCVFFHYAFNIIYNF